MKYSKLKVNSKCFIKYLKNTYCLLVKEIVCKLKER